MDTKQKNNTNRPQSGSSNPRRTASGTRRPRPAAAAERPVQRTRRKEPQEPQKVSPDVVYLAPKPFSRNRLILHLATVAAVVIALALGVSVFFKVGEIRVSGAEQYSEWEILQASGIKEGDNLLSFNRAKAAAKIQDAFPYIKSVRIGIKLPDTVNIVIEEVQVTYAVKDTAGGWWLISSVGKIVEKASVGKEGEYTKILGVHLLAPTVGQQAVAQEEASAGTDAEGNPIPVTVTAKEKLKTAVDITAFLEQNGIIGEADSIDVNNLFDIQLWYDNSRFQIKLGGTDQLSYKIQCMRAAIDQSGTYESGVLDISNPDQIYADRFP